MSSGVGGIAGIIILATAIFLLLRRMMIPRVREITGLGDVFALLLIGAIIVTGNMMRFSAEHLDLALTRDYFAGLATFVISMASHLFVLSRVDVSYAYPFLSIAYVLVAVYAHMFLGENVNLVHAAGIFDLDFTA